MKESPRRDRSGLPGPSKPPQAHSGARAGKAPSSHSSCSGRTALTELGPNAGSLTEPRPHCPHGSPLHVRHFKPSPPAPATRDSLHHRSFFPRRGFLAPLPPTHPHTALPLFFFYCYYYCLGFFTAFNTHCSKIPPPPPSPSGSRRRRFNSHFPTTGRIINLEADSPRFLRDHLGEKK